MASSSTLFGLVRAQLGRKPIAFGGQRWFSGDKGGITSMKKCLLVLKAPDRIKHRPALEWLTEDVKRMASLGATDAALVVARAVSAGEWDTATQVLQHHGSKRILFRSGDWLISQCCRDGQPRLAMSLLVKMHAQGKTVSLGAPLYSMTIKALLADGDATAAASLIETVMASDPSIVSDEKFCYQAICVFARLKQWQAALDVLQRATENGKRVLERGGCYEAAARACAAAGEIEAARELVYDCVRLGFAPRLPTYNALLGACARKMRPDVAMEILGEMRARNMAPDETSYSALMEANASAGAGDGAQWGRSLELLDELLEREVLPTSDFISALVQLCARAGRLEELPRLIERMEAHHVQVKEAMYARAMHALAKAGSWKKCLSLLSRMHGRGLSVSATHYEAALQSCVAAGQWAKCLSLGDEMKAKGVRGSKACMERLLDACLQGQRWDEALGVLRAMRQQGGASPFAYRCVLRLAGKLGRVEEAKGLVRQAQAEGIILTAAGLKGAVVACRKEGQWEEALRLVERKVEGGEGDGEDYAACRAVALEACVTAGRGDVAGEKLREWEGRGVALDEACYAAVIAGCAKADQWQEAHRLLQRVRRRPEETGGDTSMYQNVMWALVRAGRHDDVISTFRDMVEDGVAPNSRCYMSLINALKAKGDWEASVRHVLAGLRSGTITGLMAPATLAMVIGVCLHQGKWREAFELVAVGQQRYRFTVQIKGYNCAKAIDYLAAQQAPWQEMFELLQAWRHVTGAPPCIRNANKLLERMAREGQWGAALHMLRHGMLEHLGVRPDAASFATLMSATDWYDPTQPLDVDLGLEGSSGDTGRSQPPRPEALLKLMRQMGLSADAVCYTVALAAMQRSGDLTAALSLFETMRRDPNAPPGVYSYGAVLGILAEVHEWGKILELVQEMYDRGLTPTGVSYVSTAQKCLRARQWPTVLGLLRLARKHKAEISEMYQNNVLRALSDAGAVAEMCTLLREMQEEGAAIKPVYFLVALDACSLQGHWKEALELLERMGQEGLPLTIAAARPAIQACARGGAAHEAYALFERVRDTDDWHTAADETQRRWCTNDVLRGLAVAEQWERAVEVLGGMEQGAQGLPTPDRESYGVVMQVCRNSLQWEEAERIERRMTDRLRLVESESARGPDEHRSTATPTVEPEAMAPNAEPEVAAVEAEPEVAEVEAEPAAVGLGGVMGGGEVKEAIDDLVRRREWAQVVGLLSRAREGSVEVPQRVYGDVLGRLRAAGAWAHACQVIRDAQASHAPLNAACYHLALDSCSQHGRWEEAMELLDTMGPSGGVPPTVTAFALTMVSCSRGGVPGMCVDLLQRALASDEWGVAPLVGKEREEEARRRKCCNAALLGMAKGGMWETALEVLGHMVEQRGGYPSPNPATFQAVAEACGAAGQIEEQQRVERWMRERFGEIRPPGKRAERKGQEAGRVMSAK